MSEVGEGETRASPVPAFKGAALLESLEAWPDRLEAVCAGYPALGVKRVRVLAETASTQDAAWQASAGNAGWLVMAGRQTAGRGRLGRVWADDAGLGLAMTLTLPAGMLSPVAAGLAVCRAADAMLPRPLLGLRWPNDIVERAAPGRKVAGVLIETRDGVALVGIGVNAAQQEWCPSLRGRAVSLHELGSRCARVDLACGVVRELDSVVRLAREAVARDAGELDTLRGTARRFLHDGREYSGVVESIAPDAAIHLRTPQGQSIRLPADTTSLIHE